MDLSQFGNILEQAQGVRQQMDERLAAMSIEGSAGGGAVTIVLNGKKEVQRVTIDPSAAYAAAGDITMLEDLVKAAFNEAGRKATEAEAAQASGFLGGLGI